MQADYEDSGLSPNPSGSGTSFRIDEGFSEDTHTVADNNRAEWSQRFQEWIMSHTDAQRAEIAMEILQTLPTSRVAVVADRLMPMLHIDPCRRLPMEVTAQIFGYLDAPTLLTASLASNSWRDRILDSTLWMFLYQSEGWRVDNTALKALEDRLERTNDPRHRKGKNRMISEDTTHQPKLKKRATSRRQQHPTDIPNWGEQHTTPEVDGDVPQDVSDYEMLDAPASTQASPGRNNKRHNQDTDEEMDYTPGPTSSTLAELGTGWNERSRSYKPQLTTVDDRGRKSLNWAYLYKQRHRLEQNWLHGRYKLLQLPDPAFPQEAHSECVYCIQFSGKWLVSGSRDKSLRVWDLETRRLRGPPLTGHTQSVLCLQFDPSEEEDIIVSGSSDSSVIIWKFSTGQRVHEIPAAHSESVLNLRFDHRYLVTCSKDKKIKVWNRHELSPMAPGFPHIKAPTDSITAPAYMFDFANTEPSILEASLADGITKPLRAWSHLLTYTSHVAAVNAVQIHDDIIVSASGDRSVKMWSISKPAMKKPLLGHLKGIACLQYDGRRVVSGSSDKTVRIFDVETGAEVAELAGHHSLVRTVQAGFGDAPWQAIEDFHAAKASEEKVRAEIEDVQYSANQARRDERRRRQEGGQVSKGTIGAKLPPGGGGSKWGKIVSGSYDESIIIWRKNPQNGEWMIGQILRHKARSRTTSRRRPIPGQPPAAAAVAGPLPPGTVAAASAAPVALVPVSAQPPTVVPVATASASASSGQVSNQPGSLHRNVPALAVNPQGLVNGALGGLGNALGLGNLFGNQVGAPQRQPGLFPQNGLFSNFSPAQNLNLPPPRSSSAQSSNTASTSGSGSNWQATAGGSVHVSSNWRISHAPTAPVFGGTPLGTFPASTTAAPTSHPTTAAPLPPQTPTVQTTAPVAAQHPLPVAAAAAPPVPTRPEPGANVNSNTIVSRVFKLQFDARRIICCSQDSRIVGWDFANGDAEIEECAPLFVGS